MREMRQLSCALGFRADGAGGGAGPGASQGFCGEVGPFPIDRQRAPPVFSQILIEPPDKYSNL
jgi:hypothetical protein